MVVLAALRRAASALRSNPVLFAVMGVVALVQLPLLAAQAAGPAASTVVSMVFNLGFIVVFPFVQGGLLAMADEAIDRRTSLETFVGVGKDNYVQLLVGYAVLFGVNLAVSLGAVLLLVFGGGILLVLSPDVAALGLVPLALLALLVLAVVLAYLAFVFVVQFYGHAVVLDGLEAIEGFKRSVGLVRRNLLGVLGYSMLMWVAGGALGLVVGGLSVLLAPPPGVDLGLPELSLAGQAGVAAAVVALTALLGAVMLTYSVAFYRAIRKDEARAGAARVG